jgi:ppGpp synthetase/RelA/SpoT-type nucleotidyltranferase
MLTSREKSQDSLSKKIKARPDGYYSSSGKRIQDVFGVRVVCYFREDIELVKELASKLFKIEEESTVIDNFGDETFKAERFNLICRLTEIIQPSFTSYSDIIDNTFELQIRTIFSEGWHEVEHDLRYKRKDDWSQHADLSRLLNSFFASIQSSEWGLNCLFKEMADRATKAKKLESFLVNHLKIRITGEVSASLKQALEKSESIFLELSAIDRSFILNSIASLPIRLALTFDNIIYLLNHLYLGNSKISEDCPEFLRYQFSTYLKKAR